MRQKYLDDLKCHVEDLRDCYRELDDYDEIKQSEFITDYKELAKEVQKYLPDMKDELLGKKRYILYYIKIQRT